MGHRRDRGATVIEYGVVVAVVAIAVGALAWGARAIISDSTSAIDGIVVGASASPTPTGPPVVTSIAPSGTLTTSSDIAISGNQFGPDVTMTLRNTANTANVGTVSIVSRPDGATIVFRVSGLPGIPGRPRTGNYLLVVANPFGSTSQPVAIRA